MAAVEQNIWYFAIGSMINPTSLSSRNLRPIESKPAELLDYTIGFHGPGGMAGVTENTGDFDDDG